MTTLEAVLKMISLNPDELPECHARGPKNVRCKRPDGHEGYHLSRDHRWKQEGNK